MPGWYRRYAQQRGVLWMVLRLAVILGLVFVLRGRGLVVYAVLALALIDVYVRGAVRDGRPLATLGLDPSKARRDLAVGFALGVAMLSAGVLVFVIFGWYHIVDTPHGNVVLRFAWAIFFFACVAVIEETLFRGLLFRFIERKAGSWIAVGSTAALFGFAHLPNPNSSLRAAIGIAIEAGVLFAAVFLLSRSLWTCFGLHWAWNLFEGPVFGTPVSGQNYDVLLHADARLPELWTGGSFGPEAGLVLILIGAVVSAALLVVAHRRGAFVGRERRDATASPTASSSPPESP